jgi:non-ribosomal peptide synthase protein (TIGR01720 family)
VPTSFRRYARRLAEIAHTPEMRLAATTWIDRGRQVRVLALPRDLDGINSRASADSFWADLDEQATGSLLSSTGPKGTPIQAILVAALARVLGRWAGATSILLDVEGHGRDGLGVELDLSQTVGWLASIHPLWLEWASEDAEGLLRLTVARLAETPHRGSSYGLARYLGDSETVATLRAQPQAQVRLNYIGRLDALPGVAESIAPMHRGTEHLHQIDGVRRYLLECNGHVADGRLRLGLTYSTNLHDRATIERLTGEVLAELRSMVRGE